MNFDKDQGIRKLNLTNGEYYFGDATKNFEVVNAFNFVPSNASKLNIKPIN